MARKKPSRKSRKAPARKPAGKRRNQDSKAAQIDKSVAALEALKEADPGSFMRAVDHYESMIEGGPRGEDSDLYKGWEEGDFVEVLKRLSIPRWSEQSAKECADAYAKSRQCDDIRRRGMLSETIFRRASRPDLDSSPPGRDGVAREAEALKDLRDGKLGPDRSSALRSFHERVAEIEDFVAGRGPRPADYRAGWSKDDFHDLLAQVRD